MNISSVRIIGFFCTLLACKLMIYYLNQSLITEGMHYAELIEKFDHEQALKMLERRRLPGIILLEYGVLTLGLVFKLVLISSAMMAGFFSVNLSCPKRIILQSVIIVEFVHLVPAFLSFLWFTFGAETYDMQSLNDFPTFSIADLFNVNSKDAYYPLYRSLRYFNLTEIGFCAVLSYCFSLALDISIYKSAKIVFIAYFLGLLIMALLRAFITASIL